MPQQAALVLGYNLDLAIQLVDGTGAAVDVSTASEIKVAIVSPDRASRYAGPYACTNGYAGATWNTGLIKVAVVGLDTTAITAGHVQTEIKVTLGGKITVYYALVPLPTYQGQIP